MDYYISPWFLIFLYSYTCAYLQGLEHHCRCPGSSDGVVPEQGGHTPAQSREVCGRGLRPGADILHRTEGLRDVTKLCKPAQHIVTNSTPLGTYIH